MRYFNDCAVSRNARRSNTKQEVEIDDEDESDKDSGAMDLADGSVVSDASSETMGEEDNADVNASGDAMEVDAIPNLRQPDDSYPKRHSPISEPPQYNLPRWPNVPSRAMSPEWEVDKILASRVMDGQQLYLVKWKNFTTTYCTWEPEEHLLNAQDTIDRFRQTRASIPDELTQDVIDLLHE